MARGKIVLVPWGYDDSDAYKVRPCVCLTNPKGKIKHIIVAFITSSGNREFNTDIVIDESHPEFGITGLKQTSTIRLHKMMTFVESEIQRELGKIPKDIQKEINKTLLDMFELQ